MASCELNPMTGRGRVARSSRPSWSPLLSLCQETTIAPMLRRRGVVMSEASLG